MTEEQVAALLRAGEGQQVEYKTSLQEIHQTIETLCAFAHARGGTVLIGIKDDRTVVGVSIGANTLENMANELQRNTQPPLSPTIDVVQIDDRSVIALNIAAAPQSQFYQAYGRSYIRVGRTNQVMSPEAIRSVFSPPPQ